MPKKLRKPKVNIAISLAQLLWLVIIALSVKLYLDYKQYTMGDLSQDIIYLIVAVGVSVVANGWEIASIRQHMGEMELTYEERINNLSFNLYNMYKDMRKEITEALEEAGKELIDNLPDQVINTVLTTYIDAIYVMSGIGGNAWRQLLKMFNRGHKTPLFLTATLALVKSDRDIKPEILSAFLTYVSIKNKHRIVIPLKVLEQYTNTINQLLKGKKKNEKMGILQRMIHEEIEKTRGGGKSRLQR